MDQTAMVGPDFPAGKRLIEALDSDLQVETAFWWLDDETWKLFLVTPLVNEQGPRFVYSRVLDVIERTTDLHPDLFDRIAVFSPSAGVVTMLNVCGELPPLQRLMLNESIHGIYIAGAYFYKFQPSFAKAS